MRRLPAAILLLFCLGSTIARAADAPTTLPHLRQWVVALADPDPAVRERSRDHLMDLKRDDLPRLAEAAASVRPLEPGVVPLLRDIVIHVFLAGDPYVKDEARGFLGISMPARRLDEEEPRGVLVESRIPGFCAYRMLRDGDIIVDIEERPLARPVDREQFIDAVQTVPPGQLVHLKILRQGRVLRVPLRPDPRPVYGNVIDDFVVPRMQRATAFWQERFEAALTDKPKSS